MDIRQRTRVQNKMAELYYTSTMRGNCGNTRPRGSMEKIPDEVDCSRYSGMETI